MFGSVVLTVPSAAWLLQQGPKKGGHGHEHGGHGEHAEHENLKKAAAEAKDEGSDEGKDEGDQKPTDEHGDEDGSGEKEESSDSESGADNETPLTSDDAESSGDQVPKGKGERQKGPTRPKIQTPDEKMVSESPSQRLAMIYRHACCRRPSPLVGLSYKWTFGLL